MRHLAGQRGVRGRLLRGSQGKERVLVIREKGSKLPADLGGDIYAPIDNRADIEPIHSTLRLFVEKRL